jgi:hypothetical protein
MRTLTHTRTVLSVLLDLLPPLLLLLPPLLHHPLLFPRPLLRLLHALRLRDAVLRRVTPVHAHNIPCVDVSSDARYVCSSCIESQVRIAHVPSATLIRMASCA